MISIEQWRARIGAFNCKSGYSDFLSSLFSSSSLKQHLPSYPAQTQRPVHDANQHLPGACIPSTCEHDCRLISTSITTSSPSSPTYSIPPRLSPPPRLVVCYRCNALLILLIAIIFQQLIISGDIETNPKPVSRPTVIELISMRRRDGSKGNLKIMEWITSHTYTQCEKFAHKLLVDNFTVKKLCTKHSNKDEFVRAVLRRWLDRNDDDEDAESMPCTWEALVQCAKDAGLDEDFVKLLRNNVPHEAG